MFGTSLRLPHHLAVVIDAESGEISQRRVQMFLTGGCRIQILDTEQESTPTAAGEQPGEQAGAQIAQMQPCTRTRREPSVGHVRIRVSRGSRPRAPDRPGRGATAGIPP